jgi:type I restriction enzyme S subunit
MTPEFITCYLNSPNGRKEFLRPSAGSAQIVVNLSALNKLRHPLPSLPEQRAIAQVLSDVDALITALDRLIDKKRDLKQAAMQQLLTGNTRLPGFSGIWELKTLGTICEISIGRTPPRLNRAYWGRGHVWLSIADIQSKVVSCSKEEITDLAAATMSVIPKETLLMSFKLSIGRLCFAGCDLYTNEAICSFNNPQANASYLYYALSRTDLSLYGKQAVKGYTLNKESLKLIEVLLPPSPEQTAIATVLSDMDAELSALEARRDKTRALKQGMMQELLTGKTRLL